MQTVMTLHAFTGCKRSLRRQCHRLLRMPIDLSTIDLADLWWVLYAICFAELGDRNGVSSQSLNMYPLSPSSTPLTGFSSLSKASNRSDSLRMRASWTLPGHFTMQSINIRSASQITCNEKAHKTHETKGYFVKRIYTQHCNIKDILCSFMGCRYM